MSRTQNGELHGFACYPRKGAFVDWLSRGPTLNETFTHFFPKSFRFDIHLVELDGKQADVNIKFVGIISVKCRALVNKRWRALCWQLLQLLKGPGWAGAILSFALRLFVLLKSAALARHCRLSLQYKPFFHGFFFSSKNQWNSSAECTITNTTVWTFYLKAT